MIKHTFIVTDRTGGHVTSAPIEQQDGQVILNIFWSENNKNTLTIPLGEDDFLYIRPTDVLSIRTIKGA